MVYNFNLGIGWASSGVEYAQSYRCRAFHEEHIPAKFIFTDMFPTENIEHMTRNLGFDDSEIIWLYSFFTDFDISPVTFTRTDLEKMFSEQPVSYSRDGKIGRYYFKGQGNFWTVYFVDGKRDLVHRVEYVSRGYLIRKDYFTSGHLYSEYYAPKGGRAVLYMRRFFNRDGSTAYEEIGREGNVVYRFPHHILYSKEELVAFLVKELNLTEKDTVLIDRTTGIGQAILENAGRARVGIIVHADHYSKNMTNDHYILWNNYYEYDFAMHRHISFYIVSTDAQKRVMTEQFRKYAGFSPDIITIPVGSLKKLRYPSEKRKPFSMVTASRLASEKHIDWAIRACVMAHDKVPDLTLDIYGEGGTRKELQKLIDGFHAGNYIRLMGQYDMRDVYQNYELYLSASTSEGFGLSLMEAVGSGLPIVGFDVPYGNPTFIDDGKNGHLLPYDEDIAGMERVNALAKGIVTYFTKDNQKAFHEHSYEKASQYLVKEVAARWKKLIG